MKYCLEKFVTNCDKGYYKLRQLRYYKLRHGLLQTVTGITNCDDRYYKLRQYIASLSANFVSAKQTCANIQTHGCAKMRFYLRVL